MNRRALLGLGVAAPVAAAAAGPSGILKFLRSLLPSSGLGVSTSALSRSYLINGLSIDASTISAGSITADSIRVGGGFLSSALTNLKDPKLAALTTNPRWRSAVTAPQLELTEETTEEGDVLRWSGGLVEVLPDNGLNLIHKLSAYSGLYVVSAGQCLVQGAEQIALVLESNDEGSYLRPVRRSELESLHEVLAVGLLDRGSLHRSGGVRTGGPLNWAEDPRPVLIDTGQIVVA